jgi:hypothetical protein
MLGDCLLGLNKCGDAKVCYEEILKHEENNYAALIGNGNILVIPIA